MPSAPLPPFLPPLGDSVGGSEAGVGVGVGVKDTLIVCSSGVSAEEVPTWTI
jgi:hypothetical protein